MKRLLYTLMAIGLIVHAAQAQNKSQREIDGLFGPVSEVSTYTAKLFNKDNALMEGQKVSSGKKTYDRDGKNPNQEHYPYFLSCYNDVKVEITDDGNGKRTRTLILNDSNSKKYRGSWVYIYDSKGLETELRIHDSSDKLMGRSVTIYKDSGWEDQSSYFNGQGILERTTRYLYKEFDAKGNWIKRVIAEYNHRSDSEYRWAEYRTLTYHPQ